MILVRRLAAGLPLFALLVVLVFLFGQEDSSRPFPQSQQESPPHPKRTREANAIFSKAPQAFGDWMQAHRAAPDSSDLELGRRLARERRAVLKELVRIDPARALALAIGPKEREDLPPDVRDLLETPVSTAAEFERVVSCDTGRFSGPQGTSSEECFVSFDGQRYRAFTHGRRVGLLTKNRISILGIAIDEVVAVSDDPVRFLPDEDGPAVEAFGEIHQFETEEEAAHFVAMVVADEEAAGPGGVEDAAESAWTEGDKRILYLRVRFADDDPTYEPVSLATAQSHQDDVAEHYRIASSGRLNVTTVFPDMITLSQNKEAYVGDALGTMMNEARDLAITMGQAQGEDWDYRNFDFYTIISDRGIGSYAGIAQVGGPKSHHQRGYTSLRTAGHEFGHNLGLSHAYFNYTRDLSPRGQTPTNGLGRVEYGHRFSVMSAQSGSDFDNPLIPHFTVHEKWRLDWITDSEMVDITTGNQSGTYRLYQNDAEGATGVRALRIPSGGSFSKYWLSYRTAWKRPNRELDNDFLLNGVLFNWTGSGGGTSTLLDMTPYSNPGTPTGTSWTQDNSDKWDAPLLIGRTYTDPESRVSVTPMARGGSAPNEYLDVHVHLNLGTEEELLGEGAACRAIIPTAGTATGTSWTELSFDDNSWNYAGPLGVGYDTGSDYQPYFGVDVLAMRSVTESCYLRVPFTLDPGLDPATLTSLRLAMRYDDGFIAYLNGVKIAEANAPANPQWNSGATQTNSDSNAVVYEDFDASAGLFALVPGPNVLAIHGLNRGTTSSDFLMQPVLTAVTSGQPNEPPIVSLEADTLFAAVNQDVTLTATANDPEGDVLTYAWDFDTGSTFAPEGLNSPVAVRKWSAPGQYVVTVTCSDRKGGIARQRLLIKVGDPPNNGMIRGRVLQGGQPVEGAHIFIEGTDKQARSLSDGSYLIAGLSSSSPVTVGAMFDGEIFQPSAPLPILPAPNPAEVDFLAYGNARPGSPDRVLTLSPGSVTTQAGIPVALQAHLWDNTLTGETLVPFGSVWNYLDTGVPPDNTWTALAFDDSGWLSGPAELGYGDTQTTVVGFGNDPANKHLTTWFRQTFSVTGADGISRLKLSLKRDDGIRVFLNGSEVARDNLPTGSVNAGTPALNDVSSSTEDLLLTYPVDPGLLLEGDNVLAAEVHLEDGDSGDLSFDLELTAARNLAPVIPSWSVTPAGAGVSPEGVFTASQPGSYTVTATSDVLSAELNILVNSDGEIGIAASDAFLWENGSPGSFRITRSGSSLEAITVPLLIAGNATNGSDFASLPDSVFLDTGVTEVELALTPIDDVSTEGKESVLVSLDAAGLFATLSPANAAITLLDDENPVEGQPDAGEDGTAFVQSTYHLGGSLSGVEVFVTTGDHWRYHDLGVVLPELWRGAGFDDASWSQGIAKFGYGDNNETTTIDFGGNGSDKHLTTYFRRRFHLDDPATYGDLTASLLVDDGAVIYLNGTEVRRINMPTGTINFSTRASGAVGGSDETTYFPWPLDPATLVAGENIIAVEVHQNSPSSSDLAFDLALEGSRLDPVSPGTLLWSQRAGPGTAAFESPSDPAGTVTFDQSGTYVLRLTDLDSGRFDEVSILVQERPGYQQWITGYPVTDQDPLFDSDFDGFPNLLEFALGGDPTVAGDAKGPTLTDDPLGGGDLIFRYRRLRELNSGDATGTTGDGYQIYGITYTVQVTDSLGPWNPASSAMTIQMEGPPVDQGNGTELVSLRLTPPPGDHPHWFVRLKVTGE